MSVRFKVDENTPPFVAARLRAAGHDALTVAEQGISGAADGRLSSLCRSERRVLVTLDLDFADVRQYPPGSGPGIVVLRPRRQDRAAIERAVSLLLQGLTTDTVAGNLWIVEAARIRVRDRGSDEIG